MSDQKTEFHTIRFAVDWSFIVKFNYLVFMCTVCIAYITSIFQSVWHGVASYKYDYRFIFIWYILSYVLAALSCQSWKITNSTFWYFSYILLFIAQLCQTLCDPTNYSPPGSSVHGDSPGKNIGVGCHALLQWIFPTQRSNPGFLHCRQILYCWATKEALCIINKR